MSLAAGEGVVRLPAAWRGPRLFAAPVDQPRARRATDVILLVGGALGLAILGSIASPPSRFERALIALFRTFPPFLVGLWQLLFDLLGLLAVALLVAALVRRRGTLAWEMLLAAAAAIAVWLVVDRWVNGSWPTAWDALGSPRAPARFPSPRLAVAGAAILTASPYLTRPARRIGRWLIGLTVVAVCALGSSTPSGAVAAVVVAAMASAAAHLMFGSSAGRPGLAAVRDSLAELGVGTRSLEAADRQPAGYFLVHGEDELGEPIIVKVYGRDAHDTQLLATLWRTVWYREAGAPLSLGRLQQVKNEGFLTLLAGQAGVHTQRVVTAGITPEDDALLVLRPLGQPLAEVPAGAIDDATVGALWDAVHRLHRAGIAHGQLDDRHIVLDAGAIGLIDFRSAAVTPAVERVRTDDAQTLVTTAIAVGEERALALAHDALGADGLAAVLPYLQLPALTDRQRSLLRTAEVDLDRLRDTAAELAGVEPPELQQLRRVTWGSLVRMALLVVAFSMLFFGITGLDLEELASQLSEAIWWWIVIGVLVAQLPRFTQALSTLGASPVALPLGPVYALQLAVSYVNLAVPTSAARIAVNIRFFQRHGVAPGSAVAVGAIDAFAGFVVQAVLLVTLVLLTPASLDLRLDAATSGGSGRLLALLVALSVVAIAAVLLVPKLRRFVLGWARRLITDAVEAVRGLRSPRRLGLLLGGSLATEVLFACALGAFTRALGYPIGLGELVLINVSVALLAGLIPVPGGIGVVEGGLAFGLTSAGMPEEAAFAAAISYRLACFYLPPIWGFFAFRWLERNKHL